MKKKAWSYGDPPLKNWKELSDHLKQVTPKKKVVPEPPKDSK